MKRPRYRVAITVEVDVASPNDDHVTAAEAAVQRALDGHAKRLHAVAGADYSSTYLREWLPEENG